MGTAKAALEWEGSTLLARTLDVLRVGLDGPLLVVRSAGQGLPDLPGLVDVVDDPRPGRGPVQGLAAGLAAVADRATSAFVCATDLPFLHPAFVRSVVMALEAPADPETEVALPVVGGRAHPLTAAYRTSLAEAADAAVVEGRLRLTAFVEGCRVRRLDEAVLLSDPELAAGDPGLASVTNLNSPQDLSRARARARAASRG